MKTSNCRHHADLVTPGAALARVIIGFSSLLLLLVLLTGCERPSRQSLPEVSSPGPNPGQVASSRPTPTLVASATHRPDRVVSTPTVASAATETARPTLEPVSPTPIYQGEISPACGQLLPILSSPYPLRDTISADSVALSQLEAIIPDAARPALSRMLTAPETVGLAAYRVGQAEQGAYLNADAALPLASVVKLIHLVTYVEAVAAGRLDASSVVNLDTLNSYYLPGLDLGAHSNSIVELRADELILANPDRVRLEELPWMMIRHSSNAAMDYLHMWFGQTAIEETAISLGLAAQTAPCPFLGQFLAMANHTRPRADDQSAVRAYIEDPARYGSEAIVLTDAYSRDASFRQAETASSRRPSLATQRLFGDNLNPQGSAREYAALMAQIAQNGLSNPESSFLARRYLEWPMLFESNQALFSNLGYKNGAMPGILTTVYYAYPIGETTPVVVALFYRDLPNRTYQQWRHSLLPHDALARWLLSDPQAIPALQAVLSGP